MHFRNWRTGDIQAQEAMTARALRYAITAVTRIDHGCLLPQLPVAAVPLRRFSHHARGRSKAGIIFSTY